MKIGDLVRFAKEHSTQAGLDYCADWLGVIVTLNNNSVDIQWLDTTNFVAPAGTSQYNEHWWSTLDYEPFEVVSENW